MILENPLRKKKLSISLQVTHRLHAVHLVNQKTNGVITEEKTGNLLQRFKKSGNENN